MTRLTPNFKPTSGRIEVIREDVNGVVVLMVNSKRYEYKFPAYGTWAALYRKYSYPNGMRRKLRFSILSKIKDYLVKDYLDFEKEGV